MFIFCTLPQQGGLAQELQRVYTSASLSFGLSLTPLRCIPVTALHGRKACHFHVLAELRYCCFSSDTLSSNLNCAMNIGRCFVFLFPLRHLDFFEMVRNEDDLELAKRFDLVRFS